MASPDNKDPSIFKDLLFNQYQAILLAGVAGLSLLSLSPLPVLVWLGGELAVLPLLDSVPAMRRLVHRRRRAGANAHADAQREALVDSLNPAAARRYAGMENLCKLIESNYQGLSGISQVYLSEQRQKLDLILGGCLHRLVALQRYERMLAHRSIGHVESEIADVERDLREPDLPERARAALQKNLELKKRLLASMGEAHNTMKTFDLELDSMVSLLEVLHQNSVSLRDPQAISQELDTIVRQSEESERAVREMESLLRTDVGLAGSDASSAGDAAADRARSGGEGGRRVRGGRR
jgi:hypothetical protein